jgi:hypothetical protein
VLSTVTGAGWAWAALAVSAGWFLGSRRLGAVAAALALTAATASYYALDAVLRAEPFVDSDVWYWAGASLLVGMPLGVVGAYARRPDPLGVLAGLVVPAGAALQMAVLPPGVSAGPPADEALPVRWLVWLAAAAAGGWVVLRYRRSARSPHGAGDSA